MESRDFLEPKKAKFEPKMWKLNDQKKNPYLTINFTTFSEKYTDIIIGLFCRLKYQLDMRTPSEEAQGAARREPVPNTSNQRSTPKPRKVMPEDLYKALGEAFTDKCFSVIICSGKAASTRKRNNTTSTTRTTSGTNDHFVQVMMDDKKECLCFSFGTDTYVIMANCDRNKK